MSIFIFRSTHKLVSESIMGIKQRLKKLESLVNVEGKELRIINLVPCDRPSDFNYDECISYQRQLFKIREEASEIGIIFTHCNGCKEECKHAKP